MIIECPNCNSTFSVPDELIPVGGRQVKCSLCTHTFTAINNAKEKTGQKETEYTAASFLDDDSSQALDKPFAEDEEEESESSLHKDPQKEDGKTEKEQDLSYTSGLNLANSDKKPGRKNKVSIFTLFFFFFIAVGAGVYFLMPDLFQKHDAKEATPQAQEETVPAISQEKKELISKIHLENTRQYIVNNESTGPLFVLEGIVINKFDNPRELIELRAALFDKEKKELRSKRFTCGNKLTFSKLEVLSKEEIEKALANKLGIQANNINVQPNQEVPFMVVFFNLPEQLDNFEIRVVGAQKISADEIPKEPAP